MSIQIGPFFYIENKLIYNTCTLNKGRRQADKLDNSYSHEQLWDDYSFPANTSIISEAVLCGIVRINARLYISTGASIRWKCWRESKKHLNCRTILLSLTVTIVAETALATY